MLAFDHSNSSSHTRRWRHLAYMNASYPMSVAGIGERIDLVCSGPSNMHRCHVFFFVLAGLSCFFHTFTSEDLRMLMVTHPRTMDSRHLPLHRSVTCHLLQVNAPSIRGFFESALYKFTFEVWLCLNLSQVGLPTSEGYKAWVYLAGCLYTKMVSLSADWSQLVTTW